MNRPSRTDEPAQSDGYNQSPNPLSNDLTTNQDLNGLANSRELRGGGGGSSRAIRQGAGGDQGDGVVGGSLATSAARDDGGKGVDDASGRDSPDPADRAHPSSAAARVIGSPTPGGKGFLSADEALVVAAGGIMPQPPSPSPSPSPSSDNAGEGGGWRGHFAALGRVRKALVNFGMFVGPGFLIAVAYIDPGNYATDIAAGATYRFRLLFVVLLSNLFAILLQSLAIKLGTVSGLNLAEACRALLPRWLNYSLYALAEIAIVATDMAEVIGTAIALNLLIPRLPLVAGCAISIVDVMVILFFYNPAGSMRGLRAFEFFVMLLVLGVVVCFCIQLSLIKETPVGDILQGYLPSSAVVEQQGLYQACGILGATVMPHSLYLGSGIVQARLRDYDGKRGLLPQPPPSSGSSGDNDNDPDWDKVMYAPSLRAIRHSLKYSIAELATALFTFALFVNSAILIVAGASLYEGAAGEASFDSDIFGIHDLLSRSISPVAGTVFALALLLSGVSAGIVCTIAGQMVSEGALNWTIRPWLRRLVTRAISITPSIIIAGAVGRKGLDAALQGSQVALSIVLPFVSAPLIIFTCLDSVMSVRPGPARLYMPDPDTSSSLATGAGSIGVLEVGNRGLQPQIQPQRTSLLRFRLPKEFRLRFSKGLCTLGRRDAEGVDGQGGDGELVTMGNPWWLALLAGVIWLVVVAMNVANLVLLGLGR